jgi:hypothetical protein
MTHTAESEEDKGRNQLSRLDKFVSLFPQANKAEPLGSTVFRNYRAASVATARTDYIKVQKLTERMRNGNFD